MPSIANDTLGHLRQALATIDSNMGFLLDAEELALPLGLPVVDAALAGGLAFGALHEVTPEAPTHLGAVFGFALAIGAQAVWHAARHALWIESNFAALEGGRSYGPGLDLFGVPMDRLLVLRVSRPVDALWAFEEALKSPALAAVIAELPEEGATADLTATRRLSLAARTGGGLGLLLRHRAAPWATTATTRWKVAAAPSAPDCFGGFGRTAFDLSLTRNRRGPCGRFIVYWDHVARIFIPEALSLGLAQTARDRSDRTQRLVHAG